MAVTFHTNQYQASHGEPRGRGRWLFEVEATSPMMLARLQQNTSEVVSQPALDNPQAVWLSLWYSTTYGTAKTAVRAYIRQQCKGHGRDFHVTVLS